MEVKANKKLGQHFLTDQRVISQLVQAICPLKGENILEIGPGLGALTLPVLAETGQLTAVEFDHRVIEPLRKKAAPIGQLTLFQQDILQTSFSTLTAGQGLWRIIGNLPYNISSPIIFYCLTQRSQIIDIHFMLQKEFVERLCARENEPNYGRLSIMAQLWCEAESLFDIPPSAFSPPPKVDSTVVRLLPRQEPAWEIKSFAIFDNLVRKAFSQRRKMVRKSLAFATEYFAAANINPTARPETLSGSQFAALSNAIYQKENL